MNRDTALAAITSRQRPYDIAVVGGGATGAGIALDAASRGLDALLLEARDFGSGTSSRSTKIVHGGVRYLAQGRIGLVREALRERARLLHNAPHVVQPLAFVVPAENRREQLKYYAGLRLYEMLAGAHKLSSCTWLSVAELELAMPGIELRGLRGGMRYFDGQFDDTRLLLNILETAAARGADVINYADVTGFGKDGHGTLRTVAFRDTETATTHEIEARVFINATGAASDEILALDDSSRSNTIMPSQGAHIVVDRAFLPGNEALLMPQTPDGRIMFAIPWLNHVLIGTTDTPLTGQTDDPVPQEQEIDLILEVAGRYLKRDVARPDILSTFAGIRPLVRPDSGATTAQASREHRIEVSSSGLMTVSGGKWTTYRLMAEQCVDIAARYARFDIPVSPTATLRLCASPESPPDGESYLPYGNDAQRLESLQRETRGAAERLHHALPYNLAECIWAIRHEMARTVEDVLARRTRALFLNARAARESAPVVGKLLGRELKLDEAAISNQLKRFDELADRYISD